MKTIFILVAMGICLGCVANAYYQKGFNDGVAQTEKCMDNWGKMKKYEDSYVCVY